MNYSNSFIITVGIEWGEDDDDDFELDENKVKKLSEKGEKEQIGTELNSYDFIITLQYLKYNSIAIMPLIVFIFIFLYFRKVKAN